MTCISYGSGTGRDTKKAWSLQMALSICFTCNEVSLPIFNSFQVLKIGFYEVQTNSGDDMTVMCFIKKNHVWLLKNTDIECRFLYVKLCCEKLCFQ